MNTKLAILTVGVLPMEEVLPLLTEHIAQQQIHHICLLQGLSAHEVEEEYGAQPGEETLLTVLEDLQLAHLSLSKVENALRNVITLLDNQGFDVIMLMSNGRFSPLTTHNAILLEPERIVPPLVASIVDGHQVGIIVPVEELLASQQEKWQFLDTGPHYALANPINGTRENLLQAGRELVDRGVDVVVLDSLGYHQKHRDILQKAFDIPVLLSHVLVARLASELLV
ncbi:AroM family protein [Entomohabitans teleogrylli]|uniref:AroM family protein n=1 Tax=Entomohabitans teleogrylli TaxID=1384589 RepID=UPI00073D1E5D|nr:AroM family protein [Entomohabitans teleogrylli]